MSTVFLSTNNPRDLNQAIPFVLPEGESDEAYFDAKWGVAIVRLEADGQDVPPQPDTRDYENLSFDRMRTDGTSLVYSLKRGSMVVAGRFDSPADFELLRYALPTHFRQLRIEYRGRYAPGVLGAPMTVTVLSY